MRNRYINSNLNPLTKFTSSSRSTELKDILPWNISQMIKKTIPISARIVISNAMKWGILLRIWWKVNGNWDNNMIRNKFRMIMPILWSVIKHFHSSNFKSSCSQMFFKIVVLKNVAIFIGKHLCWSYFSIKLLTWRSATLLERDSNTHVFLWILQDF